MTDDLDQDSESHDANGASAVTPVGYKNPPLHSRFKPGVSGNPSGRPKGSENLRTIFQRILKEEVSLRDGVDVRKISKAEAIMRHMVVGALKGDSRSATAVFRIAEQVGEFEEARSEITQIQRVIISWKDARHDPDPNDPLPSATSTGTGDS
jgi:hypothetical protein